jgi:hypothetical protein
LAASRDCIATQIGGCANGESGTRQKGKTAMDHYVMTVSAMTIEAEQTVRSGHLERAAHVAEARRGRSASTPLVGWLQRAFDASQFGMGRWRRPIWRRAAVRPTPMVTLNNAME